MCQALLSHEQDRSLSSLNFCLNGHVLSLGFPDSSVGKRICLQFRRLQFDSWVRKIRWRTDRLPIPVFLGFPCGSAGKESACNVGDLGSIPGLERSPEKGKGYKLQYSGLENSMDCIVQGVAKSRTCAVLKQPSLNLEGSEWTLLFKKLMRSIASQLQIDERQAGCHFRSWKDNPWGWRKARAWRECPYRAEVSLLRTSDPLVLDGWDGFQVRRSKLFTLLPQQGFTWKVFN